jgi:hypothetical protein
MSSIRWIGPALGPVQNRSPQVFAPRYRSNDLESANVSRMSSIIYEIVSYPRAICTCAWEFYVNKFCPREFLEEKFSISARKVVFVEFWMYCPSQARFVLAKQRRTHLCSYTSRVRFVLVKPFKDSLWESCPWAGWNDLWNDKRFVSRCHVSSLWTGAIMAISRGIMTSFHEEDPWPLDQSNVSLSVRWDLDR